MTNVERNNGATKGHSSTPGQPSRGFLNWRMHPRYRPLCEELAPRFEGFATGVNIFRYGETALYVGKAVKGSRVARSLAEVSLKAGLPVAAIRATWVQCTVDTLCARELETIARLRPTLNTSKHGSWRAAGYLSEPQRRSRGR